MIVAHIILLQLGRFTKHLSAFFTSEIKVEGGWHPCAHACACTATPKRVLTILICTSLMPVCCHGTKKHSDQIIVPV